MHANDKPERRSGVKTFFPALLECFVSMVSFASSPSGAEIEVDGVFLVSTPADLSLTAAQRKIKISKRGSKTYERAIQVLSGSAQRISVELESE